MPYAKLGILLVLLMQSAIHSAPTTREAAVADADAVKEALRQLRLDAVRGDVEGVVKRIASDTPERAKLAEPMARCFVACEAAKLVADDRFGIGTSIDIEGPFGLIEPPLIDALTVRPGPGADELIASLSDGDTPMLEYRFVRRDGKWLLGPEMDPDGSFDPEHGDLIFNAFAYALEHHLDRMTVENVEQADSPIVWARSVMISWPMSIRDQKTIDELPQKLRALQAERQAERKALADRLEPLRVPKPVRPLADDHTDRTDPVAVGRAFARAVAAGDIDRAATYVYGGRTDPTLARATAAMAIAQHRLRETAATRIGREAADRLPMNDAGTRFVDRFEFVEAVTEDLGRIIWRDNFRTSDDDRGTLREMDVARDEASWSILPFTFSDPAAEPLERWRAAGEANAYRHLLERTIERIERGELTTFEVIRDAP